MLSRRALLASGLAGWTVSGAPLTPALAQTPTERSAMTDFQRARYLPLLAYYQAQAEAEGGGYWESLAQVQAMLGLEAEAFRSVFRSGPNGGSPYGPRPAWDDAELASATTEPALAAIAEAAKGRQIVILNEAHHTSRCRAFAQDVAAVLRKEGFTHFAAEAFANSPLRLGEPLDLKVINGNTGFYLHDPVFAQLTRQIRKDWDGCYAYEFTGEPRAGASTAERMAERDEFQAEVLANLLKRQHGLRLFIYCGFSHAAKVQRGQSKWMAARLWEKTGIEPLAITQAFGTPAPDRAYSPPGVEEVLAKFKPRRSIVVRTADGQALTNEPAPEGAYDLAEPTGQGRPEWLREMAGRKPYAVQVVPRKPGLKLIAAFPKAELEADPNSLPTDLVLVSDLRPTVNLLLPNGAWPDYEFLVETPEGRA